MIDTVDPEIPRDHIQSTSATLTEVTVLKTNLSELAEIRSIEKERKSVELCQEAQLSPNNINELENKTNISKNSLNECCSSPLNKEENSNSSDISLKSPQTPESFTHFKDLSDVSENIETRFIEENTDLLLSEAFDRVPVIKNNVKRILEVDMQCMNLYGFGEYDWDLWQQLRLNSDSLEPEHRISVRPFGNVSHSNFLKKNDEAARDLSPISQEPLSQEQHTENELIEPTLDSITEGFEDSDNVIQNNEIDLKPNLNVINNEMEDESVCCLYPEVLLNEIKVEPIHKDYEEVENNPSLIENIKQEADEEPSEQEEITNSFPMEANNFSEEDQTFNQYNTETSTFNHSPVEDNSSPIDDNDSEMVEILVPIDDEDVPEEPETKKPKKPKKKYNKNKCNRYFPRVNMLKVVGVTSLAANQTFDQEDIQEEQFSYPEIDDDNKSENQISGERSFDSGLPNTDLVNPFQNTDDNSDFLLQFERKRKLAEEQLAKITKPFQNTDDNSDFLVRFERKRKLAEEQLARIDKSMKKPTLPEKNVPSLNAFHVDKNLMEFLPMADFLEQMFRLWYGDLFLTNICAQQIAKNYNYLYRSNLQSYFIFMKYRILLDQWRTKGHLYRKYKGLEEVDALEVFKKMNFMCGFRSTPYSSCACILCNSIFETILELRSHFIDEHMETTDCCFCSTTFLNKTDLQSHVYTRHDSEIWFSNSKRNWVCAHCKMHFLTDNLFLLHVKNCSELNPRPK